MAQETQKSPESLTEEGEHIQLGSEKPLNYPQNSEFQLPVEKRKLSELLGEREIDGDADSEVVIKTPRKNEPKKKDLEVQIGEVKVRIKEKQDILRKLKLVRAYRTRWETQDLTAVTAQWLRVSQECLEDFRTKMKNMSQETGQELTLALLIQSLGLDPALLKLDEDGDCFISP